MKKMNNKGFSLVELIIVIAIMAILIAVLAPQYLRYVEKSRLQADNSTLGEVANAVKVAAANDSINNEIKTNKPTITISDTTAGKATVSTGAKLQAELDKVVGTNLILKSNSYKGKAPVIQAEVTSADGVCVVYSDANYLPEVGGTRAVTTF
ncbi:MAG: prepilin-type N-terminal cleavage/methylation domain-containing protein [Lachnospiraceae bacterium]|nr:prepilin-type N-terminal cleavage/methylation domain-containing protein [Lachnospiraceae bacterium]